KTNGRTGANMRVAPTVIPPRGHTGKRLETDRGIGTGSDIALQGLCADRGVWAEIGAQNSLHRPPGCVAQERSLTTGRIAKARGVAEKGECSVGRVTLTGRIAQQRS